MIKKIKIGEVEYEINSNAYTRFLYKKIFGKGIMEDIKVISDFAMAVQEEQDKLKDLSPAEREQKLALFIMQNMDNYIDVILQLTYTFIKCANENFMSFEDWLKTLDRINPNESWVTEVTELSVSSFYR